MVHHWLLLLFLKMLSLLIPICIVTESPMLSILYHFLLNNKGSLVNYVTLRNFYFLTPLPSLSQIFHISSTSLPLRIDIICKRPLTYYGKWSETKETNMVLYPVILNALEWSFGWFEELIMWKLLWENFNKFWTVGNRVAKAGTSVQQNILSSSISHFSVKGPRP